MQHLYLFFLRFDLQFSVIVLHFSIDKKVCTFTILSLLPIVLVLIRKWSSKALGFNVSNIKAIDQTIIELEPLPWFIFNITNIVAHFCISNVTNYASEFILIVWMLFGDGCIILLLSFIILWRKRIKVEFSWKFMFVCDLFIDESIQIKHDPLQVEGQNLRSFANPCLFRNVNFFLAKITIIIVNQLSKNESMERFGQGFWIFHL